MRFWPQLTFLLFSTAQVLAYVPYRSTFGLATDIGQLISWSAKESNPAGAGLRQNEQLGWAYDAAHNLQSRTNGLLLQTFNSDAVNELTNITRSGPITVSGATPTPAYVTVNGLTADSYGDFTFARTNLSLNNGPNTFTNIALNLYAVGATNTLTVNLPQSLNLQFDSNGNLTNDGTRSFVYNAENQLTNVYVAGAWKTEFVYDGLKRRRVAKDYGWTGSAWLKTNETRYVYDGLLAVQERDSNDVAQVTYTRGLDLSGSVQGAGGIGGLLARTDPNGSALYHADGVGNVTALMGANGDLLARYLYSPFGKTVGQWGPLADLNRYRFSSKEFSPAAGLYYYGFRFLDAGLQRWLNRDPLGEFGSLNLYRFGRNNPQSNIDPEGDSDNNVVSTVSAPAGVSFSSYPNVQPTFLDLTQPLPPVALPLQEPTPQIQVPVLQEQGADPSTYNSLLLGADHLIGTPIGEQLALDNAMTILNAPGAEMLAASVLAKAKSLATCPQKAKDVLKHIKATGKPPPGYKGGRTFLNDGRGGGQVLPKVDSAGNPITYQEFDVNPYQQGVNRGPERIVVGSDGSAHYTGDHYGSFTKIK